MACLGEHLGLDALHFSEAGRQLLVVFCPEGILGLLDSLNDVDGLRDLCLEVGALFSEIIRVLLPLLQGLVYLFHEALIVVVVLFGEAFEVLLNLGL